MTVKSWVLQRVQNIGSAAGRPDLPPRASATGREPALGPSADEAQARAGLFAERPVDGGEPLGDYAPLIGAVRAELERFVASHVRLHVVIADRDRFVLTAIGVRSPGGSASRELLQRFMREFRPEQVKRYLAREIIGRLPNAAVIDLTQFAGLSDLEAHGSEPDSEYAELLAALRTEPLPAAPAYEISVLGRWAEIEARPSQGEHGLRGAATPSTPMAGRRCEFEVDDGDGPRRLVLNAVVPGRRYVVGKGSDCDLRVDGTYTSRRHAELWLEGGTWHVGDAGSTNGIRVEPAGSGQVGSYLTAGGSEPLATSARALPLATGSRLVLSARAEGPTRDYPWIALADGAVGARPPARAAEATPPTPVAVPLAATVIAGVEPTLAIAAPLPPPLASHATPATPRTAVLNNRPQEPVFEIGEERPEGVRRHALRASELPISIGRSRGQTLVIDGRHAGVSGHHLDIDRIEADAAHGVVFGDNGIDVDGVHHATGARFRWPLGQTLVLGGSLPGEPSCRLSFGRRQER